MARINKNFAYLISGIIIGFIVSLFFVFFSFKIIYLVNYTSGDLRMVLTRWGVRDTELPLPITLFSHIKEKNVAHNGEPSKTEWQVALECPVFSLKSKSYDAGSVYQGILIMSDSMAYMSEREQSEVKSIFLNLLQTKGAAAACDYAKNIAIDNANRRQSQP